MTSPGGIDLFALSASKDIGERIGEALEIPLSAHEEREFEDGEHKARPLATVRGRDTFVIQSLYAEDKASANDKLCRLLFFIGALKDAGAARVTAITPYLCYARKDQKSKFQDPVTTRYVAAMFEAVGTDQIMTMDVHNRAAYQNAFRIPTDLLEAEPLFVDYFAKLLKGKDTVVVSPDMGGVKRAASFGQALGKRLRREPGFAVMEKYRSEGVVSGATLAGDVEGKIAVILDDIIGTGTTMERAASACQERGAKAVYLAATHGLFLQGSGALFKNKCIQKVVVTDTVPPFRLSGKKSTEKVEVLSTARLFADIIGEIHSG